jgi:hypothetical protein
MKLLNNFLFKRKLKLVNRLLEEYQNFDIASGKEEGRTKLIGKMLHAIPVDAFHLYNAKLGEAYMAHTGVRSLDAFNQLLYRAHVTLKSNIVFRDDWYVEYERYYKNDGTEAVAHHLAYRTIDSLMVTTNGSYGNPVELVARMIFLGTAICDSITVGIENNSEYEINTQRTLIKLLTDLGNLAETLIEMGYTIGR